MLLEKNQNYIIPEYNLPNEDRFILSPSDILGKKSLRLYKDQELKEHIFKKWEYMTIDYYPTGKTIARIIYDRYPKSDFHLLFLPLIKKIGNENFPSTYEDINYKHYIYIHTYHTIVKYISKKLEEKYNTTLIAGYHRVPSMCEDLHIHILSTDFKNKHAESFNKEKFISIDEVNDKLSRQYIYYKGIKSYMLNFVFKEFFEIIGKE